MSILTERLGSAFDLTNGVLRSHLATIIILIMAVAGAIATAYVGVLTIGAAMGVLMVLAILRLGNKVFFTYILFILLGYMIGGRGFAYVGFFPLYVGEVGLLLGFLTLALAPFSSRIEVSLHWLQLPLIPLIFFMVLQFIDTYPYFGTYQFDTVRDAMSYLYALYAVLIGILLPRKWLVAALKRWSLIVAFMILWAPVLYASRNLFELPFVWPGSPVPLISPKLGDVSVHLAGAVSFLLLRLDRFGKRPWRQEYVWLLWVVWIMSWVLFSSISRAGLLSTLFGVGITFILWPIRSSWHRPMAVVIVVLWFLLLTGMYSTLRIDRGGSRDISIEQLVTNFVSIIGDSGSSRNEGTKEWRLEWWNEIIDYTFNGPYFWTGKGYGINLADADGFQVTSGALRSPHNSHLMFLARSGVPGFVMWLLFLITYYGWLLYIIFTRRQTNPWDARLATWFLVFTGATLVNASFDVVLESPFSAIWFWVLIGFSFSYFGRRRHDDGDIEPTNGHARTPVTATASA